MARDPAVRHLREALRVERGLSYDTQATKELLDILGSANSRRCSVLQEIIHETNDPFIWYHLLHFLAIHRWDNQLFGYVNMNSPALERIDQAIIEVFTQDTNNQERTIKDSVLQEGLVSPEKYLYFAAAYLLGLRQDPRSIPVLNEIIANGNLKWKLRAVKALSAMKDKDCAEPLMKTLTTAQGKLHREARRALQNLGPLSKSVWLDAINHPDNRIRWEAAHGLAQIGDSRAVLTLAEGLFDDRYVIRWSTADLLSRLGECGIPAILTVLISHDISEPSRQAACHALRGIQSPKIRERIKPVLDVLNNTSWKESVSSTARDVLQEWVLGDAVLSRMQRI